MNAVGHEQDSLVLHLRPPQSDSAIIQVNPRPFDVGNLTVPGTCIQQQDNEIVGIPALHQGC